MTKNFAFLVHPRDRTDWNKGYWPGYFLPNFLRKYIGEQIKIKELSHVYYRGIKGYLVGIALLPDQIINKPKLTAQYVLEASRFVIENYKVGVIGLGALLAPITASGQWLEKKLLKEYPNQEIIVTSGNSLTAAITAEGIRKAAMLKGWNLNADTQILLLGATGSVGMGVAKLLVEDLESPNLLLMSKTERKLKHLYDELKSINPKASLKLSLNLKSIKEAEIVVVLTSGAEVILKKEYLKKHAVVYDITQPSNISPRILKERPDILVIDGGLVTTPGLNWGFDMRLPKETSFGCLAETIFLAENGRLENLNFTGPVNVEAARRMAEEAKKHGFEHAPLTSFRRLVLKEEMKEQIYLVNEKYLNKLTLLL